MKQSFLQTFSLIRSDMDARASYENKKLSALQMIKFLINPAILSLCIYRWQKFFYDQHLTLISAILKLINGIFFSVHIDNTATIQERFLMLHANFICIGANVTIGRNCMMAHQNYVCPSPFYLEKGVNSAKGPTIGDGLMMGGGAAIYGDITLGDNVKVSMNASVEASFEDGAVLFGVPARNMAKASTEESAS
jgi:serine O-acetyltransferase